MLFLYFTDVLVPHTVACCRGVASLTALAPEKLSVTLPPGATLAEVHRDGALLRDRTLFPKVL